MPASAPWRRRDRSADLPRPDAGSGRTGAETTRGRAGQPGRGGRQEGLEMGRKGYREPTRSGGGGASVPVKRSRRADAVNCEVLPSSQFVETDTS
jgi:hypothetical protein